MASRFRLIWLLAAWLFATGVQWDLVQTAAWVRMFNTYAQTMPVAEALRATFQGDNLCGVCDIVSAAKQKQQEQTPVNARPDFKLLLTCDAPAQIVIMAPSSAPWVAIPLEWNSTSRGEPAVPPPRRA